MGQRLLERTQEMYQFGFIWTHWASCYRHLHLKSSVSIFFDQVFILDQKKKKKTNKGQKIMNCKEVKFGLCNTVYYLMLISLKEKKKKKDSKKEKE